METVKKANRNKHGRRKDAEEFDSDTLLWECKVISLFLQNYLAVSSKIKQNNDSYNPAIPFLGINPK